MIHGLWIFGSLLGVGLVILLFILLTQDDEAGPNRLEKVRVYIDERARRRSQALPPEKEFDAGQAFAWLLLAAGVILALILLNVIP